MLPFLPAAGHNNYTKSALLYLQQRLELETTHQFMSSSPRATNLSEEQISCGQRFLTNLGIEQILMHSVKSNGVALLSSKQQLQRKDLSKVKQMWDHNDTDLVLKYLWIEAHFQEMCLSDQYLVGELPRPLSMRIKQKALASKS